MKTLKTLLALLLPVSCFSQATNLLKEASLKSELQKTAYSIDANAKAIVLYEEGTVYFDGADYDYKYEVITKILNDDVASDLGEISIPKRNNTIISSVSGETYNWENGSIQKTELENNQILKDQIDKNLRVTKFVLPNIKKGSIIHYTYKLHKTSVINVPDWTFQNIYPTLFSKYSVRFPINISFNKILRTGKQFVEVKRLKDLDTCEAGEFSEQYVGTGTYTSWVRRNIDAFHKEPYSSSKDNFMERIKVLITNYYSSNGQKVNLFNNWKDFSKKFLYDNEDYIGQVFKGNGFLDEKVAELTKDKKTDLEKASSIYRYVKQNVDYVDNDDENIKSVFKNQKGNVFGINMLLVAMFKNAGLHCEPIVLSTKSNERLSSIYPSPYDLNYMVADFKDNGKEYLLDATERNLPFGSLLPNCYNGYARIVNKEGGEITLSPNDIKDKNTTIITIEPSENNKELIVKVDEKLGIYKSKDLRDETKCDAAQAANELIQKRSTSSMVIRPESISFKELNNADQPLVIHYEGVIKIEPSTTLFYFNPFFSKFYSSNPFKAIERNLPIEMDYKEDLTYILNFKLPVGYEVDDYPKSINIKLDEDGHMIFSNSFNYDSNQKVFSLCSKFQSANTIFSAENYKGIREMFERMIEEQNKKIVLKKI